MQGGIPGQSSVAEQIILVSAVMREAALPSDRPTPLLPSLGPKPNVNFLFPASVPVHTRTPADSVSVSLSTAVPRGELLSSSLEQSPSLRIFIFYQYMAVTREGNMSYLSLTFLCEFRVYLSMEICTKKLQMEYLPTFLIHDRHLAKQEDDVNKKNDF